MSRKWLVRLLLAVAAGLLLAWLLTLLTQGVGPSADLSGKLGLSGAVGMGLLSGIIAAPCTGPVLAGVLTFVATRRSAILGFWLLFSYALGMGLLFFVLGATSLKLPRSGAWMETVKSVLGVALLAAAIGLLLPMLPRPPQLPLGPRTVAAAAAALAFASVLLGSLSLSF